MKLKFTFFFLIYCISINAQITDLQKLSTGKFYSSDIIKDPNNNIKGYFLLFETDKVAKETFELEYVLLDENLTKVTNGLIIDMKYESLLFNPKKIIVDVSIYKNKLLVQFTDDFGPNAIAGYTRFRILDLSNNKLSDQFIFNQGKMIINPTIDRKIKNYGKVQSEEMEYCKDVGLIVNSRNLGRDNENMYIALYDENYNQVWKNIYENGEDKKRVKGISYLNSDEETLVFFNHSYKRGVYSNDFSVLIIDAKTGKLIKEFLFPDMTDFAYKIVNIQFIDNQINILGNFSKKSEYGNIGDTENVGLFNFILDKKTGKLIESKFLKWEEINDKLDINKNGYIKKEGYIFIHNMITMSDGKIIVVGEAFEQSPISTNNLYLFELSKSLKINQVFTSEKFKNKYPRTNAHSSDIKKYGYFDFIDYQNLGDDEFLFYFNDNEKNTKNRKKTTLYGIVSYSEGKFKRQTLNLKTEISSTTAFPAKKGYLTLIEKFDNNTKPTEIRLEKINF